MQLVHMNQQMTRPSYHNLQLDFPRNVIDETSILKEISKKYILIPKLRTTFPNDVLEVIPPSAPTPVSSVKASDIDNNDWKSKYDILEQLKKKEKDEETDKYTYNDKNNLDRTIDNDVMQTYTREELPTKYEEEIPEKDVSDQLVVENELKGQEKTTNKKINQKPSTDVARTPSALSLNPENTALFYDQTQNEVTEHAPQVHTNIELYNQPEQYVISAENTAEAISQIDNNQYQENYPEQELQPEQEYPIEYEQFIPNTEVDTNHSDSEKVVNQEENDYSPIEVLNPTELVDDLNKDNNNVREANATEQEYTAETANTQEFISEEATAVLQDEQGINPENYMTDDGTIVQGNPVPQMLTEDPTDNSGIEEFDAEQREMFYSEQANENYAYEEQGAAGDAYNAEYAQNQNYPQTQEYAYYEGAEQEERAYPVEINEHEETQQLYDQHYEQQYANATNYEQGYEQQAVYMEQSSTQPQFEQPAIYDQAQQELEQYTNEEQPAETPEQVEQVLDREDGYIAKQIKDPTAQEHKQTAELTVP